MEHDPDVCGLPPLPTVGIMEPPCPACAEEERARKAIEEKYQAHLREEKVREERQRKWESGRKAR